MRPLDIRTLITWLTQDEMLAAREAINGGAPYIVWFEDEAWALRRIRWAVRCDLTHDYNGKLEFWPAGLCDL